MLCKIDLLQYFLPSLYNISAKLLVIDLNNNDIISRVLLLTLDKSAHYKYLLVTVTPLVTLTTFVVKPLNLYIIFTVEYCLISTFDI